MKFTKNTRIGLLVTGSIVLFIWGFNFLKGNDLLKSERNYYVVYQKVEGLVKASPVIINGYKVGQVRSIRFKADNSGQLLVHFVIENKFQIRKNSVAKIFSTDLMGTKGIEIIIGKENEYHPDKDTLQGIVENSLIETINKEFMPVKDKAENLMNSIDSAILAIRNAFGSHSGSGFSTIGQTLTNLEQTSGEMNKFVSSETQRLSEIFQNIESITSNLKSNNTRLTATFKNLNDVSDSLSKARIKSTIANTEKALLNANSVLEKINTGKGSLGLLINNDSLYRNLQDASLNLDKLIKDIQQNPKKYINISAFGKK